MLQRIKSAKHSSLTVTLPVSGVQSMYKLVRIKSFEFQEEHYFNIILPLYLLVKTFCFVLAWLCDNLDYPEDFSLTCITIIAICVYRLHGKLSGLFPVAKHIA